MFRSSGRSRDSSGVWLDLVEISRLEVIRASGIQCTETEALAPEGGWSASLIPLRLLQLLRSLLQGYHGSSRSVHLSHPASKTGKNLTEIEMGRTHKVVVK